MDDNPILGRIAHPQNGQMRRVIISVVITWVVTLGVSIPLSFAHHPVMDAAAPLAGPILLLLLIATPFVMAARAAQITYDDRQATPISAEQGVFRAYAQAVLHRLRWLMAGSIGLAPLTLIVVFYRAPDIPFTGSIKLLEEGLLLLPFIGLLALRPLLGAALGVWCGMYLRSRWLAMLVGPLALLLVLGLELSLERLRVIRSDPIIIGDTIEYPDVSGLQNLIIVLLVLDGLSSLAVLVLLLLKRSPESR